MITWRLGYIILNQLRLSFSKCFSETVLIYIQYGKRAAGIFFQISSFVFNRRKKVIQVANETWVSKWLHIFKFFAWTILVNMKHEWVCWQTGCLYCLTSMITSCFLPVCIFMSWTELQMNMLVCQQQLSTSHHPHFYFNFSSPFLFCSHTNMQ